MTDPLDGPPMTATDGTDGPPCYDCGTMKRARSACPLCGRVVCQRCVEKPYEFCCDESAGIHD